MAVLLLAAVLTLAATPQPKAALQLEAALRLRLEVVLLVAVQRLEVKQAPVDLQQILVAVHQAARPTPQLCQKHSEATLMSSICDQ